MDTRVTLPGTGLSVSRLCLGGNRLGGALDQAQSFALLDSFVEAGGNFIDTAHVYADWIPGNETSSSEKTLGRWLRSRKPADIVVATKGGHPAFMNPSQPRLDAGSLRHDAAQALANLGVASLDLFYLHRDDPSRPAEEVLASLEGLVADGLVRHYGASNWSAARLEEADAAALRNGWQGFAANQAEWSLAQRNPATIPHDLHVMDDGMAAYHRRTGVAMIPYSAQAKGYFDKAAGDLDAETGRLYDNAANRALSGTLARLALELGATPTQIMLAILVRAPFTTVPVVGCRTPEQVRSSMDSLMIELPQAVRMVPGHEAEHTLRCPEAQNPRNKA